MERERGLTATELTIATAIVVLGAAVAGANATGRRIEANETTAVAALEAIRAAQERFKAARYVDVDGDGVGEYGLMRELTGSYACRTLANGTGTGTGLLDPLLSKSFTHDLPAKWGRRYPSGVIGRSGYRFRIILPGFTGIGVVEVGSGALAAPIWSDIAETTWCCYAWPEKYGETGRRTFLVSESEALVATDDPAYSDDGGPGKATKVGAAFRHGGSVWNVTGQVAIDATGRDGNHWRLISPRPRGQTLQARGPLFDRPVVSGGRRGSIAITARVNPAGSDETLTLRGRRLLPNHRYELVLEDIYRSPASRVSFGTVRTDAYGRVLFRFDSREQPLPSGVASLLDYVPGRVSLVWDDRYEPVGGEIRPPAERANREPRESRIDANEAAAVAALREIAAAQPAFQARGAADVNADGVGEFGLLRELTSDVAVRTLANGMGTGELLDPALLNVRFAPRGYLGVVRAGYRFQILLPSAGGAGVIEVADGALAAAIDSQLAATNWACYAWPERRGETGLRTFFINQSGQVIASDTANYSGEFAIAAANCGAALAPGETLTSILGDLAIGTFGRDGNLWRAVPSRTVERVVEIHGAFSDYSANTFSIESRQLRHATVESITIDAAYLLRSRTYTVVLTNATGDRSAAFGDLKTDAHGRAHFVFDSRLQPLPDGVESVTDFLGGTIQFTAGPYDSIVGEIPVSATVAGPSVPGSSLTLHGRAVLADTPQRTLARGQLDVTVSNAPEGARERLAVHVVTNDRAADRVDVFAIQGGVEFPLGSMSLEGLRGAGTAELFASSGAAIPGGGLVTLSGARVEVRDPTGAVLLTGTFPSVE